MQFVLAVVVLAAAAGAERFRDNYAVESYAAPVYGKTVPFK